MSVNEYFWDLLRRDSMLQSNDFPMLVGWNPILPEMPACLHIHGQLCQTNTDNQRKIRQDQEYFLG